MKTEGAANRGFELEAPQGGQPGADGKTPSVSVIELTHYADNASVASTITVSEKNQQDKEDKSSEYNPLEHREVAKPTSDLGALAHLLKASLGSGILAMPMAFKDAGLGLGLVLTMVIGFVCTHCVNILVWSSREMCRRLRVPLLDYPATAEAAFQHASPRLGRLARAARLTVSAGILATYYCSICVYVIFIAESLKQVGDYHSVSEGTMYDVRLYVLMLAPLLLAKGQILELRLLVPFSMLANLCIVGGFLVTLYYLFVDLPPITDRRQGPQSVLEVPLYLSTTIYAMEGVGVVMPLENSMKNPDHFLGCPGVVNIAMCMVVTLYCVVGFFGYYKFGDDTQGSITLNLPLNDTLSQVVKLTIAASSFLSYGLWMFVVVDIMWKDALDRKVPPRWNTLGERLLRVGLVLGTVVVAVVVPHLGPVISLVGAVCFSTLGLLYPAVIECVVLASSPSGPDLGLLRWRLLKNIAIGALALLTLVTGAYTSIQEICRAHE